MVKTETHAGNVRLIGGSLCLDFVNTVGWRDTDYAEERFRKYSELVLWSRHAGILTDKENRGLLRKAELRSTDAKAVFERAIILRETLYRIFSAIANHHSPSISDITTLNIELSKAMTQIQLMPTTGSRSWTCAFKDNDALERILWSIARSATDLLTSNKLDRIRECSAKDCGWLFLDMSRNRSRRWCDMKDCGNRVKAQRHYQRKHMHAKNSHK